MPYPQQTAATAIALGYKNPNYVAEYVMPMIKVNERKYSYLNYDLKDNFTPVDTKVGRSSEVNLIERNAGILYGACVDHGLGEMITEEDIQTAKANKADAVLDAVEVIAEKMALAREIRVAAITQDKQNYNHSIEMDILTSLQNPDFEIVKIIETALDQPIATPNRMIVASHIWKLLRSHKGLLKTIYTNNKDGLGAVKPEDFKDYFGLDDIIVAKSRKNINNPGQNLALGNIWGDALAFHYLPAAFKSLKQDLAWGVTAEYKKQQFKKFNKPENGTEGSVKAQITHIYNEQILSKDAGVIIFNPNEGA